MCLTGVEPFLGSTQEILLNQNRLSIVLYTPVRYDLKITLMLIRKFNNNGSLWDEIKDKTSWKSFEQGLLLRLV